MGSELERLCEDLDADVTHHAPIGREHTWFGVGGSCDALVRPRSEAALSTLLRRCSEAGIPVRVLGDGANLLVADEGIDGVVVKLDQPAFEAWTIGADGEAARVRAGGGADLAKVMHDSVRAGLDGLCAMAGIPASVGGALRMNAGGRFGAIGEVTERVRVMDAHGHARSIEASAIRFDYRHTDLPRGVVIGADFRLIPGDREAIRARLKEIMAYKSGSQPMAAHSAGCMFRNPTLPSGERVSAGMLIDRAGLKGLAEGSATVSNEHANFLFVPEPRTGCASDVLRLVERVIERVQDAQGVTLRTEVVIWKRGDRAGAIE
jgi:UDP-N-acetylmuramate dehydrogenase